MGVILGQIGEEAFYQSMVLMDYRLLGFFEYPTAAVFLVLGIATIIGNLVRMLRSHPAVPPSNRNVDGV